MNYEKIPTAFDLLDPGTGQSEHSAPEWPDDGGAYYPGMHEKEYNPDASGPMARNSVPAKLAIQNYLTK